LKVSSPLKLDFIIDRDKERRVVEILLRGFGRELDFTSQSDLLSLDAKDMTVVDTSELDGFGSVSRNV